MADTQHTHHHHHRHHSKRRKHYLRRMARESVLLALSIAAALCVLLIMYCGMKDNPNLASLMKKALPGFLIIGAIVGVGNWLIARHNYDKDRN